MKIEKINSYNFNKITFKSNKNILTKNNKVLKPDIFCKSPEVREGLMNKFIKLRDEFSDLLYPLMKKYNISSWDFYINSTDENLQIMTNNYDDYRKLWNDEILYKEFLKLKDVDLENHEKKQLKEILKNFEEEFKYGEDLKVLDDIENEIAQKYNSYIPKINGKETSKTEINKILEIEENPEIRKKAYEANIQGGDLIAEDLKNFVIKRNEYAKKRGFSNYFEYKLKETYDVDLKELENLLNNVYEKSKNLIKKELEKNQEDLSKKFGIKKEDLKSYHYGLLTEDNPEKKVNDYIKTKEQIIEIAKKTYQNMGYDIENLEKEGKLTLDLFPRKGKNTHGFCFGIDTGSDARILANLTNNSSSLETLNHELGHCIYTLGNSKDLPYFDRDEYPAMTEAIAMMMQDLQKRENVLSDIIPEEILEDYKKTYVKDEIKFITKALTLINFEKQMYENPEQDLAKLWHEMKVKYQNRSENEDIDNGWATIPHFLSHPAYYQNYFRATIIKAQIYNYLVSKLGNLTENKNTAETLKNELFKFGISLEENELVEKLTGKNLSVDDFLKSIKK